MSPEFHSRFSWCGGLRKYHVKFGVSNITPRSIGNLREFSDIETGSWYLKSENKLVPVNVENRRSVKLPEWYYKSMCKLVDHEQGLLITGRQELLNPPQTAFKTAIQTRYSDLDFNLHLNTAEYYKFCSDSASMASQSGYYRHFTSDIVHYPGRVWTCGTSRGLYMAGREGLHQTLLCHSSKRSQNIPSLLYT